MQFWKGSIVLGMAAACFAANLGRSLDETRPSADSHSSTIKLSSFVIPPTGTAGLLVKASINGGPSLRLLLDSGAEYLVLDRKAAKKSRLTAGKRLDLVGAGGPPQRASWAEAATVDVDTIVLHDCPVVVLDGKVMDGIDGVLPLALFSNSLVHLDLLHRMLELSPYPEGGSTGRPGFVPVHQSANMLFVPANLNGLHEGYLLLDTGSAFNAISDSTALALKKSRVLAPSVNLFGGVGATRGHVYSTGVSFQFGGRLVEMQPVVSVDLSEMARHNGLEVAGVIGYPALAESVVTVSYREGLVRIQPK